VKRLLSTLATVVDTLDGWQSFRDGVEIKPLVGEPSNGASVALLRYRPGASVPSHRHRGFELIYVVSGEQSDERGSYPAGSLVTNHDGDVHSVRSEHGCVVLIVWERPVEFFSGT
jgi:anti-sigma factor ChrR (cupin superfamily)